MNRFLGILPAATVVCLTGCASQTLRHGWEIQKVPYRLIANRKVDKDRLRVVWQRAAYQCNVVGRGVRMRGHRIGVETMTNTVGSAELQSLPIDSDDARFYFAKLYPVGARSSEDTLPFLPRNYIRTNGTVVSSMPAEECIVRAGEYYWYVPPDASGSQPLVAKISESETITPLKAYIYRPLAVPFVFMADLFVCVFFNTIELCGGDIGEL